jgi:hypothetical protein
VFGGLLLVAVIGIASSASAAVSMYSQGMLSVKGFGNDTTNGTTYPYDTLVYLGIPLGTFCNQLKGQPYQCSGVLPLAQDGAPLSGWNAHSVPVPGIPVPFDMAQSQVQRKLGVPATTFTYGPGGTKHPQNGTPGGSFSYYFPYIYSYSYADLKNAAGSFFGGGGGPPGGFNFALTEGGYPAGSVKVTAGNNQFGGTMRLLGSYFTNNGYQQTIGLSVAISSTWLFQAVGGGKASTVSTANAGFHMSATNYGINTGVGAQYTDFVDATAFPWTTGTATVTAVRGEFFSVMKRSGYDNRLADGLGNIQMVSPMLTHWNCPSCGSDFETAAIGILKLEFVPVPEPANALMLVAGISMLGLVYRAHHRA